MAGGFEYWVQIFLNCLSLSSLLLLLAIGLTFIFGINHVVNFAHGAVYALGAYLGYTIVNLGVNFYLALILAPSCLAVVGVIIEQFFISPIRKEKPIYTLVMTFGLMIVLEGLIRVFWGVKNRYVSIPDHLRQAVSFFGVTYPVYRLFIIAAALIVGAAFLYLLYRTRMGQSMRAASRIPEMVPILGIDLKLLQMVVFAIGAMLAAIGGTIAGPLTALYPEMGHEMLVNCFVVIVMGGLGSLKGAVLSAVIVGTVQTLGYVFITDYAMAVIFALMALVLLFMPYGILGEGRLED